MTLTPTITFVYDRRKRASTTKDGSIELRITHNRKQKFIATGVRVKPKEWRNGRVVARLDSVELNRILDKLLDNVRKVVYKMLDEGTLDIDEVSVQTRAMQEPEKSRTDRSFLDYCTERAEVRKYGKTPDSQERYDRFMRFFVEWGGITQFSDITEPNIISLDNALQTKHLKDSSKWNNYHRFLNSFIMDAVDDGLIKRNPYKHVRINKDKDSKSLWKHLTLDEFRQIEKADLPTESLRGVRDLFVFQTYTCLSYIDLTSFDWSKVRDMNGKKLYVGTRGKTKQEFSFLLLRPALAILKRYKGKLPIISNVKYNSYLKAVAQFAGIEKPITSHWARHTGATILLNMGVDMEVVAKILGHSSTKMTRQVYAKLLDETVVKAMAGAERRMQKKRQNLNI